MTVSIHQKWKDSLSLKKDVDKANYSNDMDLWFNIAIIHYKLLSSAYGQTKNTHYCWYMLLVLNVGIKTNVRIRLYAFGILTYYQVRITGIEELGDTSVTPKSFTEQ